MDAIPKDPTTVSPEAILEELGRIVSSKAFERAERSTKLLRYLVEHTLNGQTAFLKEYTLGTEVLGKASSFDPRIDTIVRAEASRLRSRIERYYTTEGQTDPLVISLPKGGYVAVFYGRLETQERTASAKRLSSIPKRFAWIAGPIVAAVGLILLGVWSISRAPAPLDAPVSVAVLPFTNLSGDASQDFFSDGMTEEITAALSQIGDLRVVARTSAFQFKGGSGDIHAIGQQLHATHLIEGSVRRAGNHVRVTAQLVRADDGVHLWSQNYDRNLTDVFAIQGEIASAIAAALRTPLGFKAAEQLVANHAIDAESYLRYLRAKALLRRFRRGAPEALAILEPLAAHNPNYAPAWALLTQAYIGMFTAHGNDSPEEQRRIYEIYQPKIEAAARRAIELNPNSVDGLMMQAGLQWDAGKLAQAEDLYAKALILDSANPELLSAYSGFLLFVGRPKQSLAMRQQLYALEAYAPGFNVRLAETLWLDGQNDAAIAMLKADSAASGAAVASLSSVYASLGRYEEAADILSRMPEARPQFYPPQLVANATSLLRSAPAKTAAPDDLPYLGQLGFVYLHVGAPERAVERYEDRLVGPRAMGLVWHPSYAPVRKLERFKGAIRKIGLVDYWRTRLAGVLLSHHWRRFRLQLRRRDRIRRTASCPTLPYVRYWRDFAALSGSARSAALNRTCRPRRGIEVGKPSPIVDGQKFQVSAVTWSNRAARIRCQIFTFAG
jgi:TolB-like protein